VGELDYHRKVADLQGVGGLLAGHPLLVGSVGCRAPSGCDHLGSIPIRDRRIAGKSKSDHSGR
jgi:hypothetical protein